MKSTSESYINIKVSGQSHIKNKPTLPGINEEMPKKIIPSNPKVSKISLAQNLEGSHKKTQSKINQKLLAQMQDKHHRSR